jgi:hypothetical protein
MVMLNLFRRKPENHGRELAIQGARKRKQSQREVYKARHDEMRQAMGLPAIVWRD